MVRGAERERSAVAGLGASCCPWYRVLWTFSAASGVLRVAVVLWPVTGRGAAKCALTHAVSGEAVECAAVSDARNQARPRERCYQYEIEECDPWLRLKFKPTGYVSMDRHLCPSIKLNRIVYLCPVPHRQAIRKIVPCDDGDGSY